MLAVDQKPDERVALPTSKATSKLSSPTDKRVTLVHNIVCVPSFYTPSSVNHLERKGNYSATSNNMKLVHWQLMDGLLHLVQRGRDWDSLVPRLPEGKNGMILRSLVLTQYQRVTDRHIDRRTRRLQQVWALRGVCSGCSRSFKVIEISTNQNPIYATFCWSFIVTLCCLSSIDSEI